MMDFDGFLKIQDVKVGEKIAGLVRLLTSYGRTLNVLKQLAGVIKVSEMYEILIKV